MFLLQISDLHDTMNIVSRFICALFPRIQGRKGVQMMKARRMPTTMLMTDMSSLYGYIYCMLVSEGLSGMPIYGGALYMVGRVTTVFAQSFSAEAVAYLPKAIRRLRIPLLILLLLVSIFLVVVYPMTFSTVQMWLIFSVVLSMQLRDSLCQRMGHLCLNGRMETSAFLCLSGALHGCMMALQALIMAVNLPISLSIPMMLGYFLCSIASFYATYSAYEKRAELPPVTQEEANLTVDTIRRANALTAFERLSIGLVTAMEMTLIVMYTFLATTAEQMLVRMALAVITTLVCQEVAEICLHRRERKRQSELITMLLLGMFLWLYGLWIFSRMLRSSSLDIPITYFCMALCSVGCEICSACLMRLEDPMNAVAAFASGQHLAGYRQMRLVSHETATLLGQMLALAALTVLCIVYGKQLPATPEKLIEGFQPIMVLPALMTVVAALLCVLRFPLSNRYMQKVLRFLHIREAGEENKALEKQLEDVVIKHHVQPLGIRFLMALLRPVFRHTVKGAENIHPDENNPIVFLCNHGEIYGPVAGMLFCPVPVRPWVISDMSIDPDEVAQYVYKYTFSQIKWLGPLRWQLSKLCGPLSVWAMKSVECVPVYRHKPRELTTTFRKSVEAMQAGDNLLIFPENPDANPNHPGYEHGRPGELFAGFTMLAQVYYNKTGKRCRFVPAIAHKGTRTLSFGTEIVYDPDRHPIEERDRIVAEASRQMQALYDREDELEKKESKLGRRHAKT